MIIDDLRIKSRAEGLTESRQNIFKPKCSINLKQIVPLFVKNSEIGIGAGYQMVWADRDDGIGREKPVISGGGTGITNFFRLPPNPNNFQFTGGNPFAQFHLQLSGQTVLPSVWLPSALQLNIGSAGLLVAPRVSMVSVKGKLATVVAASHSSLGGGWLTPV